MTNADKARAEAIKELRDAFVQFSRNGRWGTCGGCPRDAQGRAYPEFCPTKERYDHNLSMAELASTWDAYFRGALRRINERETP